MSATSHPGPTTARSTDGKAGNAATTQSDEKVLLQQDNATNDDVSAKSADGRLENDSPDSQRRSRSPAMPPVDPMQATLKRIRERDINTYGQKIDPENPDVKNLTCAVCLEVFVNPKFLPCHHTYCAECIADLSRRRPGKPFKCPSCRKEVTLPPGGVEALQNNFYIKQEDLDNASRGIVDVTKCTLHAQQILDMYCSDCDQLVCFKCVWTKHKDHNMKDLADAAADADTPGNLETHRKNLEKILVEVAQHVDVQKKEQANFETKLAAVKRNLLDRHDTIVAAAKKCYDEALDQMHKVLDDVHNDVVMNAKFASSYESNLARIQRVLESAITTKSKAHVVESDRDMRVGFGARQAVDELLTQKMSRVHRPSLHYTTYASDVFRKIKDFFGTVVDEMVEKQDPPTVTVTEKFRLGDGFDTEVFSICPKDNATLVVSYERRALNDNAPSEGVDEKGKHLYTRREATGMITWKSRGNGKGVFVGQPPGQRRTYSKGQNTVELLRLDTAGQPNMADLKAETILTENPFKSRLARETQIACGLHRAFDMDLTNTFMAVLEEPRNKGEFFRRVMLFRKGQTDPVDIYVHAQSPSFAPSDLCFLQLGSSNVLVVADEWNDCLHTLDYKEGRLKLSGQLDPACPHFVQPVALNTDPGGRLWVCCRGGAVFTVENKSSSADPPQPAEPPPPPPAPAVAGSNS